MFVAHQSHSPAIQWGPASHPLFSISLVYTPSLWRSCCLTQPVSGNRPSYLLGFRPLVAHQWQLTSTCIGEALSPRCTPVLGTNLLRPRQSFEKGIKECVLTKREQTLQTTVKISTCFFWSFWETGKVSALSRDIGSSYRGYMKPINWVVLWLIYATGYEAFYDPNIAVSVLKTGILKSDHLGKVHYYSYWQ